MTTNKCNLFTMYNVTNFDKKLRQVTKITMYNAANYDK